MKVTSKEYVARVVIFNVLTVGLDLPLALGMFTLYEYPNETAVQYHLGQGEREAEWDSTYPKWYNYVEFRFEVNESDDYPIDWASHGVATGILKRFLAVLQMYSSVPLSARIHAIRPADRSNFIEQDVDSFPKDIGGEPGDPDVWFIAEDNVENLRRHYETLWDKDWQIIKLPVARYMNSFTRDIFREGFEPDDAFLDLMISLENLFGSQEAVGYKIALRAACFLEEQGENRRELNRQIKSWYGKRSRIAHGTGESVVDWKEVEEFREVVRQSIMKVWEVKCKGDDLDGLLFLGP